MERAIATVEQAMAAVTPLVVPGVTMLELAEAVEHELLARRLALPVLHHPHVHRPRRGRVRLAAPRRRATPIREGTSVMFDFGGVVDGYCSDFGRTVYCGDPPQDFLDDMRDARRVRGRQAPLRAPGTPRTR